MSQAIDISVVVIGRNEGERLLRCLSSVRRAAWGALRWELIYVDSGSSDGSAEAALGQGAQVIALQPQRPCAALGRNAGWRAARGAHILFLDGDTELHPGFPARALRVIKRDGIGVVWGHRRERSPEQSLYVRVLDLDWVFPTGPSPFCGGDALLLRRVLEESGGFAENLIAGEEPELCHRIRSAGWIIEHIDAPMTRHDLAITRLSQYWLRAWRAGFAYAEVARLYAGSADPLWSREARHNQRRGAALLGAPPLLLSLSLWLGTATPLLLGGGAALALVLLTARRCRWKGGSFTDRLLYAIHAQFQHIPILFGQIGNWRAHRARRTQALVDYKEA